MATKPNIRQFAAFGELRRAAPALWPADAGRDPWGSPQWFELLVRHGFDPAARLQLLLAEEESGAALACLPLAAGASLTGLGNYYGSLFEPIGGAAAESAEVCLAWARHLRAGRPRRPVIALQPLDPHGGFYRNMAAALRAAGYRVGDYFCFGNWFLPVEGSFDAYFRARPSALRHTVLRGRRKLDRAGPWAIDIVARPGPRLATAIGEFEAVYASSWKPPEPFPGFIPAFCRWAAESGTLRLGLLRRAGRAVAAQIWLVHGGSAEIYKLAYDPAHARFSAGSVLTAAMMAAVIDGDRVGEVDFLHGDEPYKRDWMAMRRERRGLLAADPLTARGLAAAARHGLGRLSARLRGRTADGSGT